MTGQSIWLLALGLVVATAPIAMAQTLSQTATLVLPDAPEAVHSSTDAADNFSSSAGPSDDVVPTGQPAQQMQMASRYAMVISPGQQAPSLTGKDKFLMGAKDTVTLRAVAGWLVSAGYSDLTNGPPNYGTNSGAFGRRLGATAICNISEDFFSTSVMSNLFREDPRYYRMGRGHSISKRIVYAATRALLTRTDSGKTTPNFGLLTGNLAGAAMTSAYYPQLNHGVGQALMIFGGSIGGSAVGFGVREFLPDALQLVHHRKSE